MVYEMLKGQVPWGQKKGHETVKWLNDFEEDDYSDSKMTDNEAVKAMTKRILRDHVTLPESMPAKARDFLSLMLCPRAQRKTVKELMEHPWLSHIDFDKLREKSLKPPIIPRLDRANIDKSMGLVEFMMEEEERKLKKVRIVSLYSTIEPR